MMNFLFLFVFFFSLFQLQAELPKLSHSLINDLSRSDQEIINQYIEIHRRFSQQVCSAGTEERYWQLNRDYRGFGFYVPTMLDDSIDLITIRRFLPELQAKKRWITLEMEKLESPERVTRSALLAQLSQLENMYQELLELNKKAHFASTILLRESARIQSRYKLVEFRSLWMSFLTNASFIQSYRFPVDHFDLRKSNDRMRATAGDEARRKANEIYFYRQIVQDGAQNPDRSRSDSFLRGVLDTITLDLKVSEELLSENLRYDLDFAFSGLRRHLSTYPNQTRIRLNEWLERTQEAYQFYLALQDSEKKIDDQHNSAEQVASTLATARNALKDFSMTKQAQTYRFWMEQSELMRALFSIETILYNEVADLDGREALERRDITQVVMNRIKTPRYSIIPPTDPLFTYINKSSEDLVPFVWLNALFKRAEFSFTLYFINSNVRVFCPEMTARGQALRRQNLEVGLYRLRNPDWEFDALRYFSRHSMQGRIDMSEIWSDYQEVPLQYGAQVAQDRRQVLERSFKRQHFTFYHRFVDRYGDLFDVLEIAGTPYVRRQRDGSYFAYRNPHFFRYYRAISQ